MTTLRELSGTYALDPTHTRIGFVARHAMVSKVRGQFNEYTGTATIDGANPNNSTLEVSIQVTSIDTREAMRDGHLRSGDFFEADQYPTITFKGTSFDIVDDETVEVTGDLTIKATTRSITIPFTFGGQTTDPYGTVKIGFEGSTKIKRSDFGMTWNAFLEAGGVMVSDVITLEIDIEANKTA
jgi:polyisoprenoid-binding protein YceI